MAASLNPEIAHGNMDKVAGLPILPEILELIFHHMDEGTFFIALQTCKQFAEAGSTRKNLLRQVERIPGGRQFDFDYCRRGRKHDFSNDEFRQKCYRHAARSGCMAWVLADLRRCKLPSGTMLSKSAFSSHRFERPRELMPQLALANDNGSVTIYSLSNQDVRQTQTLDLPGSTSPHERTRIHAMAFSSDNEVLVVIHSRGVLTCQHDDDQHVNQIKGLDPESEDSCHVEEIFDITTFYICDRHCRCDKGSGDSATSSWIHLFTSHVYTAPGYEPVSVALASDQSVSIAWKVFHEEKGYSWRIEVLTTNAGQSPESLDSSDIDYASGPFNPSQTFDLSPDDGPTYSSIRMKWLSTEPLLISRGTNPLYNQRTQTDDDEVITLRDLYRSVRFTPTTPPFQTVDPDSFRIDSPFYGLMTPHHGPPRGRRRDDSLSFPVNLTYLALGILTLVPDPISPAPHLYVLTLREISDSPYPSIDTDSVFYPSSWTPTALLAGWSPSSSSISSPLAVSEHGNRIATADWDKVLVWTLDPKKLCTEHLEAYFPERDFNTAKQLGRIRPVRLPGQGVVHQLKWVGMDVLYGLTDWGVVRWDVGPSASGKRGGEGGNDEGDEFGEGAQKKSSG